MIIVRNRELLIPHAEQYIGTTYDDNSDNRQFLIDRVILHIIPDFHKQLQFAICDFGPFRQTGQHHLDDGAHAGKLEREFFRPDVLAGDDLGYQHVGFRVETAGCGVLFAGKVYGNIGSFREEIPAIPDIYGTT